MKITPDTHPGPWRVFCDGEEQKHVISLDTVTGEWVAYVVPYAWAHDLLTETHQARAITVNGWRVDIWEKAAPPEIPPPCWDSRTVDPERAMAATRALCG